MEQLIEHLQSLSPMSVHLTLAGILLLCGLGLPIPEDISLPWSEGVCRFVVEGGPNYTIDAQKVFPKSSVARLLDIRTFVSYPVFSSDGKWFGTLCGASKDAVRIEAELLDLMRECARLIGQRIAPR